MLFLVLPPDKEGNRLKSAVIKINKDCFTRRKKWLCLGGEKKEFWENSNKNPLVATWDRDFSLYLYE